jgi:hypothetical protein
MPMIPQKHTGIQTRRKQARGHTGQKERNKQLYRPEEKKHTVVQSRRNREVNFRRVGETKG